MRGAPIFVFPFSVSSVVRLSVRVEPIILGVFVGKMVFKLSPAVASLRQWPAPWTTADFLREVRAPGQAAED
jgi:hypothetical protein